MSHVAKLSDHKRPAAVQRRHNLSIITLKRKNQRRPLSHSRPNLCFVAVGFRNRLRHLQAWHTLMCLTIDQSWFQHSPASPWHQMPRTIYCIYQDNSTCESWGAEHCCCTRKCIITKHLMGLNKKLDAWVLELIVKMLISYRIWRYNYKTFWIKIHANQKRL